MASIVFILLIFFRMKTETLQAFTGPGGEARDERERAPGVNRQTAGNLARQPPKGAVCKVQCDSNPNRRMIALPNPTVAKRQKHCALQDLA